MPRGAGDSMQSEEVRTWIPWGMHHKVDGEETDAWLSCVPLPYRFQAKRRYTKKPNQALLLIGVCTYQI